MKIPRGMVVLMAFAVVLYVVAAAAFILGGNPVLAGINFLAAAVWAGTFGYFAALRRNQ